MPEHSRVRVFREILSRPNRGLVTLDEAAGQLVYAIDDPCEVDEVWQLASIEMRQAIQRFVQKSPKTNEDWAMLPSCVLDGDEQDVSRFRLRVRNAIEALRKRTI